MTIDLFVQRATAADALPTDADFESWISAALEGRCDAELTVRLVDSDESRQLNAQYRGRNSPTNVLSFPADIPAELKIPLLGDIVICAPVVGAEAQSQGKTERDHWAHLTIHGVLHLLGFDHQVAADAEEMEAIEIRLLASLGIADPYR